MFRPIPSRTSTPRSAGADASARRRSCVVLDLRLPSAVTSGSWAEVRRSVAESKARIRARLETLHLQEAENGIPSTIALPEDWLIGLHVSHDGVVGVLSPPATVRSSALPMTASLRTTDVAGVLGATCQVTKRLAEAAPSGVRVASAAVAVGGHVSADGRNVVFSPDFRQDDVHWSGVPLAAGVERCTGLPTQIVNDANALAVQEQIYGDGRGVDNFAAVMVGRYGLGCGIIANGRLVVGNRGSAGEIGHIRNPSGGDRPCRCGGTGRLERYASVFAIDAQLAEDADSVRVEGDATSQYVPGGLAVWSEAGAALGHGLAAVVNLLNPEMLTLHLSSALLPGNGTSNDEPEAFALGMSSALHRESFSDSGQHCRVVRHHLTAEYLAQGAASYARSYRPALANTRMPLQSFPPTNVRAPQPGHLVVDDSARSFDGGDRSD